MTLKLREDTKQSKRGLAQDKRKRAKKIAQTPEEIEQWEKHPNQSDKEGSDTPDNSKNIKQSKKSKADELIESSGDYNNENWRELHEERENTKIYPLPFDSISEKFLPKKMKQEFEKIHNLLLSKGYKIHSLIHNNNNEPLELSFSFDGAKEEFHKGRGEELIRCRSASIKNNKYFWGDSCAFSEREVSKETFYEELTNIPDFSEYIKKFPYNEYQQEKNLEISYMKGIIQTYFTRKNDSKTGKADLTAEDSDANGRWITVNGSPSDPAKAGTHVFVREGESVSNAVKRTFQDDQKAKETKVKEKKEQHEKKQSLIEKAKSGKSEHFEISEETKKQRLAEAKKKLEKIEKSGSPSKINEQIKKELRETIEKYSKKKEAPSQEPTTKEKEVKESTSKSKEKKPKEKEIKIPTEKENKQAIVKLLGQINKLLKETNDPKVKKKYRRRIKELTAKLKKFSKNDMDVLSEDLLDIRDFTISKETINGRDFTKMYGPLTRAGAFEYPDPLDHKKKITYVKDYDNLKEVHKELQYRPIRGTAEIGSHKADIIGYAHKFEPRDDSQEIYGEVILFDDIDVLSNLPNETPREVSMGFKDHIDGNKQIVDYVDHYAISLDNKEMGRCRTGSKQPCFAKVMMDFAESEDFEYEKIGFQIDNVLVTKVQCNKLKEVALRKLLQN